MYYMDKTKISDIGQGITGCSVTTSRFKTSRISVNLFMPLLKETVSANALLPFILTRASKDYPDFSQLNAKLADLYGASLYGDAGKFGDSQFIKITIAALDDLYVPGGQSLLPQCADLLISLLFEPPFINKLFDEKDFHSEKRLMIERIEAEINDKRKYALIKTESVMCEDEPFGLPKYGTVTDVEALENASLYFAWQKLLKSAVVRINVVGSADAEPVFEKFKTAFALYDRSDLYVRKNNPVINIKKIKQEEERMAVTQGKLVMGFRAYHENPVAMRVATDMFGGGPHSLLFANVREKQSLCYYCAARYNRHKGIITVDCGMEEENREKAEAEIIKQLDVIKSGGFDDNDLNASKLALIDVANSIGGAPSSIDGWYTERVFEEAKSPQEFAKAVEIVSKDDVIECAKYINLDAVYFLGGNGEAE